MVNNFMNHIFFELNPPFSIIAIYILDSLKRDSRYKEKLIRDLQNELETGANSTVIIFNK